MLRITGDVAALIELAERTGSLSQLRERFEYLNAWGEASECHIRVDLDIAKVDMDKPDADISVRFYGIVHPPQQPTLSGVIMNGGLNLYKVAEDAYNWSVNT